MINISQKEREFIEEEMKSYQVFFQEKQSMRGWKITNIITSISVESSKY